MTIKMMSFGLALMMGLLSGPWGSAAELTWSATGLVIQADPKKPTAEAVYAFKNETVQTVVITSAAACCDCVQIGFAKSGSERRAQGRALQGADNSVGAERRAQGRALQETENLQGAESLQGAAFKSGYPVALAPGEAGELRATFTLGARTGRHEKAITVTYLDERSAPSVLRLSVDIPDAPVRLSAESVRWKQGGAGDEQAVDIILTDPEHTTVDSVQCAEPNFAVTLEPAKAPGSRRVLIKPLNTEKLAQGVVRIQATVNGVPRVLLVRAMVR